MDWISYLSLWLIPMLIALILIVGVIKKIAVYETFVEGAKEGFDLAVSIIPFLVGMMVAISVFRESGAMELMVGAFQPLLMSVGVPTEIVPLALIRPISGTGALGMTGDLISTFGPDSLIGRMASTMQGSTDTTLYVLTVYFGAVGVRKVGDALKVGLLADVAGMTAAVTIILLIFG